VGEEAVFAFDKIDHQFVELVLGPLRTGPDHCLDQDLNGLILGLAYIAAINGLFYVCSLFLQTALGLSPSHAALGLAPTMIGMMASSFIGCPLIPVLGRRLVFIGLMATLGGGVGLWVTITAEGTGVSVWLLAPSFLVMGAGMGTCLFSIFDFAIGDVAQDEAGSASGSLSAAQNSPPQSVVRSSRPSTSASARHTVPALQ
jgi:MFS family permease